MGTHHIRHLWSLVVVALVSLGVLVTPAEAYDNPELLPDHPTPVIDLAKVFSDTQRAQLEASLAGGGAHRLEDAGVDPVRAHTGAGHSRFLGPG